MGHDEAVRLLEQTLEEEKAADATLSELAEDGINQQAADTVQSGDDDAAQAGRSRAGATRTAARSAAAK